MRLGDARIGYGGYSRDFSAPGDRRRFVAYARMKGLAIERARLDRPYDLAYVTYNSDLPGWTNRKRREGDKLKLIFELVDAYFTEQGLARRLLKGAARRALGTDSRLSPDLRATLIAACRAADVVICSTEEQREVIRKFNRNVFLSFDCFDEDLGAPKADYIRTGKLKLVWEGQSTTLPNLQGIRQPLNALRDRMELHVVTDPVIHRYFARFGSYPAMDALRGIECDIHFHEWDRSTFSDRIIAADVAVIPIDQRNALWWGKPENKLALLWQLGMPVLTSATPAYQRAMRACGLEMTCASLPEWSAALDKLAGAEPSQLAQYGRTGQAYASRVYSTAEFIRRFDDAFGAVGIELS